MLFGGWSDVARTLSVRMLARTPVARAPERLSGPVSFPWNSRLFRHFALGTIERHAASAYTSANANDGGFP